MPPSAEPVPEIEVRQRDSEFVPLVIAARVGSLVRFPNDDSIQHHVYSISPAKRFDLPLQDGADASAILLDKAGVVSVGCNIHDWMRSYIVVVATPYFARSEADGTARLSAPSGRYRREIWHYLLAKPQVTEVTLVDDPETLPPITLTLRRDRHPDRHEIPFKP
ncbi:MAG: methylamine utilization protein [Verrucomicrobia bacterium]|nr:MAG: methylamine utilization protein [Verrucomicrobiota bacterium]